MVKRYITNILVSLLVIFMISSCKKFLDTKSSQNLSTPDSLKDLQALLNSEYFYRNGVGVTQTGSDEYYLLSTDWENLDETNKLGHIWDEGLDNLQDWETQYSNILIANVILDRLSVIGDAGEQSQEIKGAALFFRSQCFYQLAQLYAPQYDPATSSADLGIVLRLDPDFNKPSRRSTVQQSYEQIIDDLSEAVTLLPTASSARTRPNKASAYALLARTYLQTGDYTKAKEAADGCLQLYSYLIDYNDNLEVDTSASEPFSQKGILNKEIIFYLNEDFSITLNSETRIDSTLYSSYDVNDIRRLAFFDPIGDGTYRYKGSYNGIVSTGAFVGLGTAEVYLIRAECYARLGNTTRALDDLDTLLIKRYKAGTFGHVTASTPEQALEIILKERKKEMVFRGMRWADLKRLNKEPARVITLKRVLDGQEYTLPPNDLRYTLLIPQSVMELSNLQQNPR